MGANGYLGLKGLGDGEGRPAGSEREERPCGGVVTRARARAEREDAGGVSADDRQARALRRGLRQCGRFKICNDRACLRNGKWHGHNEHRQPGQALDGLPGLHGP